MAFVTSSGRNKKTCGRFVLIGLSLLVVSVFMTARGSISHAQVTPITSSGLGTNVSSPIELGNGVTKFDITGGTRPGGGVNLFHSFGEFGVPTDNIANFLNEPAFPTTNILSRVTGGNPSNILGTIQTEGFGNANLFLMNPAGIVFGPDASLNVSGSTHFTTADYLRLADGVQFTALPSAQDALLSIAPVAAFGFLGTNPSAISVQGSTLTVSEGQTLSLVGGDVAISSGLNAPGGEIAIASVASPGEVLADTFVNAPNVNGESFTAMGNIVLSEGATLDASGDAAGTVIIRGGALRMTNAVISADTADSNGAPLAVDIQVSGDLTVTDTQGTQGSTGITARTIGSGNAGEVRISSGNLVATSSSLDLVFALIDTHTSGSGTAGNVNMTATETIHATGENAGDMYLIDSGTIGGEGGHGGGVTLIAKQLELTDANINTGDFIAQDLSLSSTGSGGNLTITADTVQLTSALLTTDGFNEGKAGDINIIAHDIQMNRGSTIRLVEFGGGGALTINTNSLSLDSSVIEGETVDAIGTGLPWTGVTINAEVMTLQNGSSIKSQTFGDGAAGDIRVMATDRMIFSDVGNEIRPSGLFTNSLGNEGLGDQGPAGNIFVETGHLELSGGARIDSATQSSGKSGDVTILASDAVLISGQRVFPVFEVDIFGLGSSLPSGIFSRTVGSEFCTGPCGDAGNISMATGSLNMTDGAAINSGTTSSGQGAAITVNALENISIAGTLEDGTTPGGVFSQTTGTEPGSGAGGQIALAAGQNFTLSDGATVSASSSGPGNAGNLTITAHDTILIDKAFVTTEAKTAFGGNITLTSGNEIQLTDSQVTSLVQEGSGSAGSINLDPDFIVLKKSNVLSTAVSGDGGPITLTANKAILVDSFSKLDARSQFGGNGIIDIQAPIQNLSGTIAPLPQDPAPVTALYGTRCVAGEGGQFSTFVDSKTDSLSPTPGAFLASPLLPQVSSPPAGVLGHAGTPSGIAGTGQTPPIQLAAYVSPVLSQHGDGMLSACP